MCSYARSADLVHTNPTNVVDSLLWWVMIQLSYKNYTHQSSWKQRSLSLSSIEARQEAKKVVVVVVSKCSQNLWINKIYTIHTLSAIKKNKQHNYCFQHIYPGTCVYAAHELEYWVCLCICMHCTCSCLESRIILYSGKLSRDKIFADW